jgi:hypothetical protein
MRNQAVKWVYRWGLALLLLPLCFGFTGAFVRTLTAFKNVPEESFYFFLGMASYFAFEWVFFRPMRTYVFGHELTHALAAWMSGAHVKKFKVGKSGGSVSVSKTNLFVALAPYFIPLYAMLMFALYAVAGKFYPLQHYWRWLLWLIGAALGFHAALTVYALKQNQPDLKQGGIFLSAVVIYLGNMLLMSLFIALLFPKTISWKRLISLTGRETVWIVQKTGQKSVVAWRRAEYFAKS